jgi:galactokinase/galactose mutarotase-like enzyme
MPTSSTLQPDLESKKERAQQLLSEVGQQHLLEGWSALSVPQREGLLAQIEEIDWRRVHELYQTLVREKRVLVHLPEGAWEPAEPIVGRRETAETVGRRVLADTEKPRYGLLVVAGGSGSGLKFPHAKGLFPATPLSGTPLYEAILEKAKAAAQAYGHDAMFPVVLMVSPETEAETRAYLEEHGYFGEPERIRVSRQQVLPMLDRRPGHEGRALLRAPGEIAVGGAGHGDAFDYTLSADTETVAWLEALGVRYMHFLNVDNLLNPVGDPFFLGEHIQSESPPVAGRAHISVMMVPKPPTGRMGNIIQHRQGDRLLHESIDYGLVPEVDARCRLGHSSVQIVTLASLRGTVPIPFMVAEKELRVGDSWVPVWKFERSSNNKARYGALLRRESYDVFASIKKRSEDAREETPATAARLQSNHWKSALRKAGEAAGSAFHIPESAVVELPWETDFLEPETLAERLAALRFPTSLQEEMGYRVFAGFTGFREVPLSPQRETPRGPMRSGRKARRWEDQSPDEHRIRGLIAAFNNHFEADPDILVKAPGRNTLLGDHQDYPPLPQDGSAASFTIAWASRKNVMVTARRRADRAMKLLSVNHGQSFTFSLEDLDGLAHEASQGTLSDVYGQELYPWARSFLAFLFSAKHGRVGLRTGLPLEGAEFAIEGNVPLGAGQSSSAAFLVAATLTCNELFDWGIPRADLFTLADLARAGEHEDYSPFITRGRCGYLDQITSLAGQHGKAVLLNHGNYREIRPLDLNLFEHSGYEIAIVLSGLSRSLGETEYATRVDELTRLPHVLNRLLAQKRTAWTPRDHIHQFHPAEWEEIAVELEAEDPTLARRARYLFEENERTAAFLSALERRDVLTALELVNASGYAMSMNGPYQISGFNRGPANPQPFAALDTLRNIVLGRAGVDSAARMIGGGGAGPLCLLVKRSVLLDGSFAKSIVDEWREKTGLTARVEVDPPASGAEVLWRRPAPEILAAEGPRRIESYLDAMDERVYRLVDETSGMAAEIVPSRGTIRSLTARINGVVKAILFNPEANPAENGAAPYLGPWINRIKDGRASFAGHRVNLMQVKGVRDDGFGHALHGLMTLGWHIDLEQTRLAPDGIRLTSWIDTADYTDDPAVRNLFGPSRTVLVHRLQGTTLHIESTVTHLGRATDEKTGRIPVFSAVHPWFLLDQKKHAFAEVMIPAQKHRITWKKAIPRLQMIPVPYLPALPIPAISRHFFRESRRLGNSPYDDTYTRLIPAAEKGHPVATLRDWFRDLLVEVGVLEGYDEFTLYRPANVNVVCLEPQISSINAIGHGAPLDAAIPTIAPGESFTTRMYIRATTLSRSGVPCMFSARPVAAPGKPELFPKLLSNGLDAGPLAEPGRTTTHKDAIRIFFAGRWHIYGTGHEMRDLSNPPPGHRPQRRSILFHLASDSETGPYLEENPPVLLGDMPKGIYEAPSLVAEGNRLHLFAQTTYYRLGGTIEHFVSTDGHTFTWTNTALRPIPGSAQAGIYDVDACELGAKAGGGQPRQALIYSGFSRDGGRDDRPDPCVFLAESRESWEGLFVNGRRPILTDRDVAWHNSHDPANPYYEWGLEGAQLLRLSSDRYLLLCVGFEKRPGREYMAAQRLFFAHYDNRLKLLGVSEPILPLRSGWDEYGHGSMMLDVQDPAKLRLLFQARPANLDKRFRDTDSWRLFEAIFDIRHLL